MPARAKPKTPAPEPELDVSLDELDQGETANPTVTEPDSPPVDPDGPADFLPSEELSRGAGVLEELDVGMAVLPLHARRYGLNGGAMVVRAASSAQDARGGADVDLIVLAVDPGRRDELVELLTSFGVQIGG